MAACFVPYCSVCERDIDCANETQHRRLLCPLMWAWLGWNWDCNRAPSACVWVCVCVKALTTSDSCKSLCGPRPPAPPTLYIPGNTRSQKAPQEMSDKLKKQTRWHISSMRGAWQELRESFKQSRRIKASDWHVKYLFQINYWKYKKTNIIFEIRLCSA